MSALKFTSSYSCSVRRLCRCVYGVILTNTLGSIGAAVVAVVAHYDLFLARVGAHCVDTVKACAARLAQAVALIYICRGTERERIKPHDNCNNAILPQENDC